MSISPTPYYGVLLLDGDEGALHNQHVNNDLEIPKWLQQYAPAQPPQPSPELSKAMMGSEQTIQSSTSTEESAVEKLQKHLNYGAELLAKNKLNKITAANWTRWTRAALVPVFGRKAGLVCDFDEALKTIHKAGVSVDEFRPRLELIQHLIEGLRAQSGVPGSGSVSQGSRTPQTKKVFVIHGHDELNTRRLKELLRDSFQLEPVVILARAGMSRPLIDKFEDDASICSFAFALVTPDDIVANHDEQYAQARSNVVFEIGWFVGRLGRQRIALLLKDGTSIHTDLHGVSRIQFRDNVEDKFVDIQRELKGAGLIL
jgi:hypothetical protein